jgi:hypothetical protein
VDEYLGVDRALALALALSEGVRDADEVEGTERKSKSKGDLEGAVARAGGLEVLDDVDRVEDEVGADQLRSRRSSILASCA